MQVKHLLLALLLCSSPLAYGQKPYYNQQKNYLKANSVWVFGHHAGLNFNSGNPIAFTDSIDVLEGCASIADPVTGQLLFYSDGKKCWNRNNQVMPNGDSLLGNKGSTSQGVCIVPMIDSPGKYYLFSLSGPTDWLNLMPPTSGTLFYSIVDMDLDNGLGDIVSTQKNIRLSNDTLSELMIAIPGNNCDIWLLVHDFENPIFKAYHITSKGLDTIPVISISGQQIQGSYAYTLGHLCVSPDRSMIALTSAPFPPYGVLLTKFDATIGSVSNAIKLTNDNSYDVCFSPDNTKLYATNIIGFFQGSNLIQWDISNYDSALIVPSMKVIDSVAGLNLLLNVKLYEDKIYSAQINAGGFADDSILGVIHYPNLSGQACDYDSDIASLLYGCVFGPFSNDVVFPLPPDTINQRILDTAFCGGTLTLEGTSGYSDYYWDDGSTGKTRIVSKTGIYWVLDEDNCHSKVDTFAVNIFDLIPPIIAVDSFTLSTTSSSYATYQWMLNGNIIPGATKSTYNIIQNGNYQVIVSNEQGCLDTSDVYPVTNYTGIKDVHELAKYIKIYPNPTTDNLNIQSPVKINTVLTDITGKVIREVKNPRSISLKDLSNCIYLLRITDTNGILIKVEKVIRRQ